MIDYQIHHDKQPSINLINSKGKN